MSHWLCNGIAGFILLASASGSMLQRGVLDLTIEAPPSLAPMADRVRSIDRQQLAGALAQAGLTLPPQVHVTLIPEDDSRARATPGWIVARAFDSYDVVIFPARVGSYPYGSLESVVARGGAPNGRSPAWAESGSALWIGILALAFIAFMSTLHKRARRRRQWDEEEVDA